MATRHTGVAHFSTPEKKKVVPTINNNTQVRSLRANAVRSADLQNGLLHFIVPGAQRGVAPIEGRGLRFISARKKKIDNENFI